MADVTEESTPPSKRSTWTVQTSLDAVTRRPTYHTTSVAGVKRPQAFISASDASLHPRTDAVLADITNRAPSNAVKRPNLGVTGTRTASGEANGGITHRRVVPSSKRKRLIASAINDLRSEHERVVAPESEYSQRRNVAATPGPAQNPLLSLSHPRYDLPEALVRNFSATGINSIYPWQSSCLLGRGLLEGQKNLIYSAPTGGGKSLVADVLLLKRVIENPGKKALLVLPYVALVQEKLTWLRRIVDGVRKKPDPTLDQAQEQPVRPRRPLDDGSIRVAGFFGGSKARATWADVDIAVCTIEKANAMINTATEDCTIDRLGIIVIDELHMLDDEHRGYLLELMATKIQSLDQDVQVVGMSATLSNIEVVAKWLDAKYYESRYRPVPIEEYLVYEGQIFPAGTSSAFIRTTSELNASERDPVVNAVVALAMETVLAGYGALIFCNSRKRCERMAALISETMPLESDIDGDLLSARFDVFTDLRNTVVGLDPVLHTTIMRGVAFHHAGLTSEERGIVTEAYNKGIIKVIIATCSLAAGINLPARRVILYGARMGRDLVGPAMLRQMRGRAGRKGKDEVGETFLCCELNDLEEVMELLQADIPKVESSLAPGRRGMRRALLEVVATRLATSAEAIDDYVKRTLLCHSMEPSALKDLVQSTLEWLLANSLLALDEIGGYMTTVLGSAIVASSLTPEDGLFVQDELQRALRAFVMDGEMHVFYMFTPIQPSGLGEVDWQRFADEMDRLDDSGMRVLDYVGIKPARIMRLSAGAPLKERTAEELQSARVYRRFYAALQLRDLCNEMPIHAVATKYSTERGSVQNLAQTCHGFAAGMVRFCERMGWGMLAAVLEHMSDRLKAGARADLLDLARVTFVKSRTARTFWESGIRSIRSLAESEPTDIVPILMLAQPRKLRLDLEEETRFQEKLKLKAEIIIKSASWLWEQEMRVDIDE
ncbi:MAG: hypothetical protein M1833_000294 [Piccolia ochrophora]|nr:MAG: hypothetical protein M1833_000294 [Piccolia ochrophora]